MTTLESTQVVIDYDVSVPMPDGVVLAADVFRPAAPGRYPAILVRTPYGKLSTPPDLSRCVDPLAAARDGYVVVIQDMRGTGASGGDFRPYADMADDGAASVEWVAAQEWSDGSVGMAGFSHLASAQLLAATRRPTALKAIAPALAPSEFYEGCRYQGGALQLHNALPWAAAMSYVDLLRREQLGEDVSEGRAELEEVIFNYPKAFEAVPQADLARRSPWLSTYAEWLAHPDRDEFWRAIAVNERYESIDVPALHLIGWYDNFLKGTLDNYLGMKARAASEHARSNQRLIIGPWGHGIPGESLGELWFGPSASSDGVNVAGMHREFFNAFLKGEPRPETSPVTIFVMGANYWREENEWPLTRAVSTPFYLRADNGLSTEAPADELADSFRYDPSDPVPTLGGNSQRGDYGPRDRHTIEQRPDVLVYTTAALSENVEVTGPLTARLYVATSAQDTDFSVTLVDVYPNGRALGIAAGMLRLRYREGFDVPRLAQPGEVYEINVDLVATSNVFCAGHRIRVEISSSNFPHFDRNPNNGGVIAEASKSDFVVATQEIFHDTHRASHIVLPVVPA